MIRMIMALGINGELGYNNKLLDHVPEDLDYFKKQTLGSPVIMGSKTFFGLPSMFKGNGLPGRHNIVLTRQGIQESFFASPVTYVSTVAKALKQVKDTSVWIIGGAEIYYQFQHLAEEVHVTRLNKRYRKADVFYNSSYLDNEKRWKLKEVVHLTDKIHVDVYTRICK